MALRTTDWLMVGAFAVSALAGGCSSSSNGGEGGSAGSGGSADRGGSGGITANNAGGSGGSGGSSGSMVGSGGKASGATGGSITTGGAGAGGDAGAPVKDSGSEASSADASTCPIGNPWTGPGTCGASLAQLEATSTACEFGIPPLPTHRVDPKRLNVVWRSSGGQTTTLGLVCRPEDCPTHALGWYYDDNLAPKVIVLCPDVCASLGASDAVELLVNCPTRAASPHDDAGADAANE